MPTYSVRTDNGGGPEETVDPLEFPHDQAACDDAQRALAEMAKDKMPLDRDTHFGVEIENEAGDRIYSGSLDVSQEDGQDPDTPVQTDIA